MYEYFARLSSSELIWIIAIGGGLLWGIVCSVGKHWERIRKVELKQDMLNRGMSAEEIKTVLDAGSNK